MLEVDNGGNTSKEGPSQPIVGDDRERHAVVAVQDSFDSELQPFHPAQRLIDQLQKVSTLVKRTFAEVNKRREEVVGQVSSFLKGATCLGQPPNPAHEFQPLTADKEPPDAVSLLNRNCFVAKPNHIPWVEWLPPADILTSAPWAVGVSMLRL